MEFIEMLKEALKAKGANAWTEEELEELFAEEGEVLSSLNTSISEKIDTEIEGLLKKNSQLLGEKKKLQTKLREGSTEDIASYEEKIDLLNEELEKGKEQITKLQREAEKNNKSYTTERDKLSKVLSSEKEAYNALLIENEVTSGLQGVNINPAQLPIVKEYLKKNIVLIEEEGKRKPVARHFDEVGKEVQMPFSDYVKTIWSASEEGKSFIVNKASGSGANQGAGGSEDKGTEENHNPFAEAFGG